MTGFLVWDNILSDLCFFGLIMKVSDADLCLHVFFLQDIIEIDVMQYEAEVKGHDQDISYQKSPTNLSPHWSGN